MREAIQREGERGRELSRGLCGEGSSLPVSCYWKFICFWGTVVAAGAAAVTSEVVGVGVIGIEHSSRWHK